MTVLTPIKEQKVHHSAYLRADIKPVPEEAKPVETPAKPDDTSK